MLGDRQPREGDDPHDAERALEESDASVVPEKPAKTWVTPVESVEGRVAAKGKSASRNALWTQGQQSAPTDLERIGERARQRKEEQFNNLLGQIKEPLLAKAYGIRCTNRVSRRWRESLRLAA